MLHLSFFVGIDTLYMFSALQWHFARYAYLGTRMFLYIVIFFYSCNTVRSIMHAVETAKKKAMHY